MTHRENIRRIKIEFGHCDPLQIVYYPNYAIWCDQATHHLFEVVGLPLRELQTQRRVQVPLVDLSIKFTGPARRGDVIEVGSHISRWGSKSFDVSHRIRIEADGPGVAEVRETRACVTVDPSAPGKIAGIPIPGDVRSAFEAAGLSAVIR